MTTQHIIDQITALDPNAVKEHLQYAVTAYAFLLPAIRPHKPQELSEAIVETYDTTEPRNAFYATILSLFSDQYYILNNRLITL